MMRRYIARLNPHKDEEALTPSRAAWLARGSPAPR